VVKALGKHILVKPFAPTQMVASSLLFVPETLCRDTEANQWKGTVVAIGNLVREVAVGDTVLFREVVHWKGTEPYYAKQVNTGEEILVGLTERDVIGVYAE